MSSCSAPCSTCSSVADGRGTVDGCSLRVTAEAGRRAGGSGYRRRRGAATGPGGSPAVPTPSLEVVPHNNTGGADTVNNLYIAARRPTVDRRRRERGPPAPARAIPADPVGYLALTILSMMGTEMGIRGRRRGGSGGGGPCAADAR